MGKKAEIGARSSSGSGRLSLAACPEVDTRPRPTWEPNPSQPWKVRFVNLLFGGQARLRAASRWSVSKSPSRRVRNVETGAVDTCTARATRWEATVARGRSAWLIRGGEVLSGWISAPAGMCAGPVAISLLRLTWVDVWVLAALHS